MDIVIYSALKALFVMFSFAIIGGIFSFIGTIGKAIFGNKGTGSTKAQVAKIDYQKMIQDQKDDFEERLRMQADQSRRTTMMIALGGGGLVFVLIMFMMMGKK